MLRRGEGAKSARLRVDLEPEELAVLPEEAQVVEAHRRDHLPAARLTGFRLVGFVGLV